MYRVITLARPRRPKKEGVLVAKVLVVEDDEDLRRLIVLRIRSAGHAVNAAGDAAEALRMIEDRGAPEVAVLDVGLPDMEGTDLLVAIREKLGVFDFPAVFLSARVNQRDVEKGRALGAQYLTKPFVTGPLLRAIDQALPAEARAWQ